MGTSHEEFLAYHQRALDKMKEITRTKNHDYSGGDSEAFANFEVVAKVGVASVEQGFLTRMLDKFMRITNFTKKGELLVKDESVEDTLFDLANYCILFAGYLNEQRQKQEAEANAHFGSKHPNLEDAF